MNLGKYRHILFSLAAVGLLLVGLFLLLNETAQVARAAPGTLFVAPGGSGDCSQAIPCDLQAALSTASEGDTLYLAQGIYTGAGGAVITVTRSITLYGGWDGSQTTPPMRDPVLFPTTLDGERQRRVVYVDENVAPTIDGLIITGGNATGLDGGLFAGSDSGGGIYSLNASPLIQNNVITNNIASTQAGVRALGGGIYINSDSTVAVVRYNQIISNTAGVEIQQGDGGGLFINGAADVLGNTFQENSACKNCDHASGGGVYIGWTTSEIVIAHNLFENNQARWGGGIHLVWSAVHVSYNTLIGNTATQDGAGLYSHYDKGSMIIANMVISNTAADDGGGLGIYITQGPEPTQLVNNIIVRNQAGSFGGGLYASSDWIISAITLTHNTIVSNGIGIGIGGNMTATLVNNIIVSHTLGITVTEPDGNIFAGHTLFWGNTDDGVRGTNPVDSDPAFFNPDVNDYHIGPDSGAIDQGVDAGVAADIDGDPRPAGAGYDIGADEMWNKVYLPLVSRSYQP